MSKDLLLLADWLTQADWPPLRCHTCLSGFLEVAKLERAESSVSSRNRDHEAWEPEWVGGTFQGTLQCRRPNCEETVSVVGDWKVDMLVPVGPGWHLNYGDYYRLRFAAPAIPLLALPAGCSRAVTDAVDAASRVIWADPGAAANRLRYAVEMLLTDQKVAKTRNTNKKRVKLTAHTRIELFSKRNPLAADALMAVKWIGNAGSHADALSVTDVINGSELLGYALKLVYDRADREIERRVRQINRARGLPKASRKKS